MNYVIINSCIVYGVTRVFNMVRYADLAYGSREISKDTQNGCHFFNRPIKVLTD